MDSPRAKLNWDDYRNSSTDERCELIDGELYAMAAAPLSLHQILSGEFFAHLWLHFRGRACKVIAAPLDVKLSEFDTVQPDIVVICQQEQILSTHVEGPPQLAIEILSPSSLRHDRILKFNLYAKFGVKEYWLVHPTPAMVEVFLLEGERYVAHGTYSDRNVLQSPTFPGLRLDLSEIFPHQEIDEIREATAEEVATLLGR